MSARKITQFWLRIKNQFWLLVAIALTFALRVYALGAQSLWNDEGISVALAQRSLSAIVDAAAKDIQPPLYYFLLHFWIPIVGNTEYAVRFLSVVAAVLVAAVAFRLGRDLFDLEVGNLAAYLVAFSPFLVYYAQEARMYIWVTLFTAVSALAMTQLLKAELVNRNSESRITIHQLPVWFLYILATIAALYTHYFAVTVVAFEDLAFLAWLFLRTTGDRRPATVVHRPSSVLHTVTFWLAAQVLIAAAYAPWYFLAGSQLATWPAISEPFDLVTLLWRVLNVFSVGLSFPDPRAALVALSLGFLFVVGWRWTRRTVSNWGVLVLSAWTLVPIAAMYVVSLSRPAYNPKFLLLATPAFYILAARGLACIHPGIFLHQRHDAAGFPPVLGTLFMGISIVAAVGVFPSLGNYYFDPQFARDDYRGILQTIDSNARPGDGILVDDKGQIEVVRYYYRGDAPLFLLPRMRPSDPTATRADIDEMMGKVQRLYAIYYATQQADPEGIVETRLAEKAYKASDEWHGNVRLAVYGIASDPCARSQTLNARFGNEITLASYCLDTRVARRGDVLTLTLNWRAEQTPTARVKVFVHLLDAGGRVAAQRDGEPVSDTRITTTWRAGETIADRYGVLLDAPVAPGEYQVEIGMYRADSGERLPVGDSDHLIIGTVLVQ